MKRNLQESDYVLYGRENTANLLQDIGNVSVPETTAQVKLPEKLNDHARVITLQKEFLRGRVRRSQQMGGRRQQQV